MSGYFDVARCLGLNPIDLAQKIGIGAAALANPDDRVPVLIYAGGGPHGRKAPRLPSFPLAPLRLIRDGFFWQLATCVGPAPVRRDRIA